MKFFKWEFKHEIYFNIENNFTSLKVNSRLKDKINVNVVTLEGPMPPY